jgi:AMMECR1 domain-containing protein
MYPDNRFNRSVHSILFFFMVAFLLPLAGLPSDDNPFQQWVSFSRTEDSLELITWLKCRMREEFIGGECKSPPFKRYPPFFGRFGLFITLKRGREIRGCYGAFDHRSESIELTLIEYLRGALRSDPRYEPVDISEIGEIDVIITVAERPFPVRDINVLDIYKYGIIVTGENNESTVFVPAEVRSIEYLKSRLKLKRIIQIAAFRAATISGR